MPPIFPGDNEIMGVDQMTRIRNVTAVLGPTNTGKTHLAIERRLGHRTGMIGLPLRLQVRSIGFAPLRRCRRT